MQRIARGERAVLTLGDALQMPLLYILVVLADMQWLPQIQLTLD